LSLLSFKKRTKQTKMCWRTH